MPIDPEVLLGGATLPKRYVFANGMCGALGTSHGPSSSEISILATIERTYHISKFPPKREREIYIYSCIYKFKFRYIYIYIYICIYNMYVWEDAGIYI